MTESDKTFLFDLLNTPSPTGFEAPGQRKWAGYVREFADAVDSDAYGNAWATVRGTAGDNSDQAPSLMLEAHADEIGYMIKHITSDGYLQIDRIGGVDHTTARGRRLVIFGDKGDITGVIGNTAIHIRDGKNGEKAPQVHELYVDVGAASPGQVAELGIRVGHPAVYADDAMPFGTNRLTGRALDNRLGSFIIARVLASLAESRPPATVLALNAVQEEIGGHGARMAAHRLQPDLCLVLDVTHATDTPGIEKAKHGHVELAKGPTLTHGTANHPAVVQRLMQVAEQNDISLQHEASSRLTGTDADQIYDVRAGIPTALVSLPLRYMHSVVEVADFADVDQVIRLLTAFAKSLQPGDRFTVEI